jgi:cold shock CspA family protein
MTNGTVRWFDVHKGYGFIKPDDGGVDVLVDICAVERAEMASLNQGQRLHAALFVSAADIPQPPPDMRFGEKHRRAARPLRREASNRRPCGDSFKGVNAGLRLSSPRRA